MQMTRFSTSLIEQKMSMSFFASKHVDASIYLFDNK
jgi:hypothetical protein